MAASAEQSVSTNVKNQSDENDDIDDTDNEDDKGSTTEETAVGVGGGDGVGMETDVCSGETEAAAAAAKAIRLGRKGDPRMHKALEARLHNPDISHVDALIAGGFDIPADCTNDDAIIDGVTLSQRKNQLSRRLRNARKQQRIGGNSKKAIATAKSSSSVSTTNKKRKQSSSTPPSANNSISSSSTTDDTATLQRVMQPADDKVAILGGGGGISAATGTNINRPQQLSLFPTPNPMISQPYLNNHHSSLTSIIAAQRAALESFQCRLAAAAAAEKQMRRRSSLDTTSTSTTVTTMNRGNIINNNHNNNNAAFNLANNTTNTAITDLLQQQQQQQQQQQMIDVSCADATPSSTLAASLLAQQQLEYHRQQLAQLLASSSTSVAANGHHFPYDPTMANYFGIPAPFGTSTNALPFGGPPTTSFHPPPSSDPTNGNNTNTTTTPSNAAAATYPNALAAAAAVNMNTAVHSQSLASLALANNPMLYSRGFPFPFPPHLAAGTTATMNTAANSNPFINPNCLGPQQQQQSQIAEQMVNFNLKHAIDTSIAELIKKSPKNATTTTTSNEPTTATTTTNTNVGGSILDESNHSDFSNLNSICSKKSEVEESVSSSNNNNNNNSHKDNHTNEQEGRDGLQMKRRESSKEALNLFASIGKSQKNLSSSTVHRKFSLTRIQPAADLMSVLLSDFEDDSCQDFSNAHSRRSSGTGILQKKQDDKSSFSTNQGEGTESLGKVSFSITPTIAAATNGDSIKEDLKSSCTPARSTSLEENLRKAFHEFNSDPLHASTVAADDSDRVKLAVLHHKALNQIALKESMIKAGFEQHQASDLSPIYIEIAFLSLEAEVLRFLDLKRRNEDEKKLGESIEQILPPETRDL
jgi:hypothetical protein